MAAQLGPGIGGGKPHKLLSPVCCASGSGYGAPKENFDGCPEAVFLLPLQVQGGGRVKPFFVVCPDLWIIFALGAYARWPEACFEHEKGMQ